MAHLFSYLLLASRWYLMYFSWMFLSRCLSECSAIIHFRFRMIFFLHCVVRNMNVYKKDQMSCGDVNDFGSSMNLKRKQCCHHRWIFHAICFGSLELFTNIVKNDANYPKTIRILVRSYWPWDFDDKYFFLDVLPEQLPLVVISDGATNNQFPAVNIGKILHILKFWRWCLFSEASTNQNHPIGITTMSSLADTRRANREKVIAETYWQHVFEEEQQKKT
jgi:hypothetical protein